jgi:hypothetical protein
VAYPSVAFKPISISLGLQPIAETSAIQNHTLGMTIRAVDTTYGEAEFIYLKGVASTAAGDLVVYDSKTGATLRAVTGGTTTGPVGVAMSANTASRYGWYALSGSVPVSAATASADTYAHLSATAGRIDDAASATERIDGMLIKAATSGDFATCQLSRPSVSGLGGTSGTNTGDITLATVGSSPAAAGASLSGQVLTLQPASTSHAGVVSVTTQSFTGTKSFASALTAQASLVAYGARPTSIIADATGITNLKHGEVMFGQTSFRFTYQSFTTAGATHVHSVAVIPANMAIRRIICRTTTAYAGLAGTITLKLGTTSGGEELLAEHDVKTAAIRVGNAEAHMGASMVYDALTQGCYTPSLTGTTTIYLTLTSGTGDIGAAGVTLMSAGQTDLHLVLEAL